MVSVLLLGDSEKGQIAEALKRARERPVPWRLIEPLVVRSQPGVTLTKEFLKEIQDGITKIRTEYPSQTLVLGTYVVSLSFEEQPAGLTKHLSVSSHAKPDTIPNMMVVHCIAKEYGFSLPIDNGSAWVEEYQPGQHCINLTQVVEEK